MSSSRHSVEFSDRGADHGTLKRIKAEQEQTLENLVAFGNKRAEQVKPWVDEFRARNDARDHVDVELANRQQRVLAIIEERMIRGEYLVHYDGVFNPEFEMSKVFVGTGKGSGAILPESHRPFTRERVPLLTKDFFAANTKLHDPFDYDGYEYAITTIYNHYHQRYRLLDREAYQIDQWLKLMREEHSKHYSMFTRVHHAFTLSEARKRLRYNLIIVAEKGQDRDRFVLSRHPLEGYHSLARISLRNAARIGYHGRLALDGGMNF
ncbi:hypothetical protein JCM10212_006001 [Sporobolomyces blumeae]